MATKAPPTQEELAQVRRMRAEKPYVSPEVVAEGAARTPKLTRFIIAKQRRLETLQSEASPVGFSLPITGSNANPFEVKAPPRGGGLKTHFTTARLIDDRNAFVVVDGSNHSLPHTPVTSRQPSRRFPRVKGRRDVYELPEDNPASVTALAQEAPSAPDQKRSAITLDAEPTISSFCFPDTPSSLQSQETRTLEECLKAARKASQGIPKEFHNNSQHPPQSASGNRITGEVTAEHHELPFSPRQEEQLTDLDLEILHLGEDNHEFSPTNNLSSRKRVRSAAQGKNQDDSRQFANEVDGESDVHLEQSLSKKRRRSGRQIPSVGARKQALQKLNSRQTSRKGRISAGDEAISANKHGKSQKPKKKKRRLPVNELVTVGERPGTSDIEVTSTGRQAELSQDPISQQADDQDSDASEREHCKPSLRVKINIRPHKGFGAIDISLFRMPEIENPPSTRIRLPLVPSDGFEGKEAAPIGLYMPAKCPTRRRESYQKIAMKFGELTLVPEKPLEAVQVKTSGPPLRKQRHRGANPTSNTHAEPQNALGDEGQSDVSAQPSDFEQHLSDIAEAEHDQNHMLIDGPGEEMEAEVSISEERRPPTRNVLQERHTPTIPSIGDLSETPVYLISPLTRKQSAVHNDCPTREILQTSQTPDSQRLRELLSGVDDVRISQQLVATSVTKKTRLRARKESLEVTQELRMVSVQKRPKDTRYDSDSSDKEGDSDRESAESYLEAESENEDASEEEEEEEPTTEEEEEQDGNHDESGDEEDEEELHDEEAVAENADSDNPLQGSAQAGAQELRGQADMSVNPEVSSAAQTGHNIPQPDQESQDTRAGNVLDAAEALQEVASQALKQLSASPRCPMSLPGIGKQDTKDNMIAVKGHSPQRDEFHAANSGGLDDPDGSWRPPFPETSGLVMEVDEDIIDSPKPAPPQVRQVDHRRSSRRRAGLGSQQLTVVRSRRNSLIPENELTKASDTQGSVELGDSRTIIRRSLPDENSETQRESQPEIPETQFSFVHQRSYMERALGQLSSPVRRPSLSRTKSMPARVFFLQPNQGSDEMLAGGITVAEAFQHTVSPVKSGSRLRTLLGGSPGRQEQSLKALTRQASLNLGTLPESARKRTISLQFKPPFLPSTS